MMPLLVPAVLVRSRLAPVLTRRWRTRDGVAARHRVGGDVRYQLAWPLPSVVPVTAQRVSLNLPSAARRGEGHAARRQPHCRTGPSPWPSAGCEGSVDVALCGEPDAS